MKNIAESQSRSDDVVVNRASLMECMIADMVAPYSYPVAFNTLIGHVDHNVPVVQSATVTLDITPLGGTLSFK